MKLLLSSLPNASYPDYITMQLQNPFALDEQGIDNGELDGIRLEYILEYVQFPKINEAIKYFLSKVKLGGEFSIKFVDFPSAHSLYMQDLDLDILNRNCGGKTLLTMEVVRDIMRGVGCDIRRADNIGAVYIIEGTRVS